MRDRHATEHRATAPTQLLLPALSSYNHLTVASYFYHLVGNCTMTARTAKIALCLGLLTLLPGCVEVTQIITLNPDGKGKMKIEVVTAAYDFDFAPMPGAPGGKKKKPLNELKREAITKFLAETPGVTAFKDVTVKWTHDGKLHMVGTAYFERLEDLDKKADNAPKDGFNMQSPNFRSSFKVALDKDKGTMRITAKNDSVKEGVNPLEAAGESVDFAKMTDKEIDEHLLAQRVEWQKVRPLMEMMFNDLKVKAVLHLPGDIVEVKGFHKEGKRTVSQTLEGKAIMAVLKKIMMIDRDEVKKLAAGKNEKDLLALIGPMAQWADCAVTVNNLGAPQFDFDKEVREARAAYPALRKALGLDDSVRLPGE
jgi:hypothetical protein